MSLDMSNESEKKEIRLETQLSAQVSNISDFLMQETGLPKGRIKHAMSCGALQIKKPNAKYQRVRRATAGFPAGSLISFHYRDVLLAIKPDPCELIEDFVRYSVWFKPPGVMSQGYEWGDHCSVLRLVQQSFDGKRDCYVVHRLDRDACGVIVIAHDKQAAAKLSDLFVSRKINKSYRVRVDGIIDSNQKISTELDGKEAISHIEVLQKDSDSTQLSVKIETGRKHQIRRHLSQIGHSVVGDALYGARHIKGLHLTAAHLSFLCPLKGRKVVVDLELEKIHKYWQ